MIHHACPKCEELQIEVDWLRKAMGVEINAGHIAAVQNLCVPHLTPFEARFLLVLHEARGRVVGPDLLDERLPQIRTDDRDYRVFRVYASRLRARFGHDTILTVYGQGYRLNTPMIERIDALLARKVAA